MSLERYEWINTLYTYKKSLNRKDKVGAILLDHWTQEKKGYSYDEAFQLLKEHGGTNVIAGQKGRSIEVKAASALPPIQDPYWQMDVRSDPFQEVKASEELLLKIERALLQDIQWALELRKRQWKSQNKASYERVPLFMESIVKAADWLKEAQRVVVITGAGVSTESGVPDFRSEGESIIQQNIEYGLKMTGFYRDQHPREYGEFIQKLVQDMFEDILPDASSETLIQLVKAIKPNDGHRFLYQLESKAKEVSIFSQNVDGLHEKAGNKAVFSMHGSFFTYACSACVHVVSFEEALVTDDFLCTQAGGPDHCHGYLLPDLVLFGDPVRYLDQAKKAIEKADVLMVLGTSLEVYPVADLPSCPTKAKKLLINHTPTKQDHLFDLTIHGPIATILAEIDLKLGGRLRPRCEVCKARAAEGVYASRIAPVSSAYCPSCMDSGAEPYGVLVTTLVLGESEREISPQLQHVIDATLKVTGKSETELWTDVEKQKKEPL